MIKKTKISTHVLLILHNTKRIKQNTTFISVLTFFISFFFPFDKNSSHSPHLPFSNPTSWMPPHSWTKEV